MHAIRPKSRITSNGQPADGRARGRADSRVHHPGGIGPASPVKDGETCQANHDRAKVGGAELTAVRSSAASAWVACWQVRTTQQLGSKPRALKQVKRNLWQRL